MRAGDLRWTVELGLAVDHQGWHPTSLRKYRARVFLHQREGLALANTWRLAEELGTFASASLAGPREGAVRRADIDAANVAGGARQRQLGCRLRPRRFE